MWRGGDGEEDHCFATLILVFGILVGLKFLLIVSVGQEAAGEKGGIKIRNGSIFQS